MLGYSEEQALGRHFAWFFPVDEWSACCVLRSRMVFISGKAHGCGKTIHDSRRGSGSWRCAVSLAR